ncbi:MAG TPA: cytochrome C oxidase subunit IV family protein [Acidobacteriota bacterium]|nr:cytochrome C oxidase subunit IV family protein [Acidobacteriota bacterium]HNB69544.1 cytochrome C oxidase subunit IV family protein [Acidobacteriota bacterium]HNC42564.1 cytochrome C oxidase subunit IV family protein [Acidobacteriota bacterium]HNG91550.1 cytochrome C oxidase subunit IV family protein [Acidobacteriota bacterium]HNH83167.1 cytochrome C oxidase subunit IV family protein [Acidobacteriota bacterium]
MAGHVVPLKTYLSVFGALMVLTGVTVWIATFDLGVWNAPLALAVATTKMVLIVLFFMHVKYSTTLTKVFVASSFFFVAILFFFTFIDYFSRHLDYLPR